MYRRLVKEDTLLEWRCAACEQHRPNNSLTPVPHNTSAVFNLGFSMGEDIPDGESTHLSEGLKQRVSINVTYDVEGSVPDVQVHESSLFADDLWEFVAPVNHDESSMVEGAPFPRHIADDSGIVTYQCVDSATSRGKVLFI